MTLTELRYIVALAQERHFGRASSACFVTQPTLSLGVKRLEDELGITLFERTPGGVRLTPAGVHVVEQAKRILDEVEALKRLAKGHQDPLGSPLSLGVLPTVAPYLLPHLIPIVHERAPRMPLLLEEAIASELEEKLKGGAIDAAIVSLPFEASGIILEPLYEEPFVVALPADHPWADRRALPGEALAEEHLILLGKGHCFREQVIGVCKACRPGSESPLQKTFEGSSLETIRYMVASGVGITVLPCTAAQVHDTCSEKLLTFLPFEHPPKRTIALAWRKGFSRVQALHAIKAAVGACPLACIRLIE